jgi:hypothetical protein
MAPQKQSRPCHKDREQQRNSAPDQSYSEKNYRAVKGKESVKRKFQTKIGQPGDEEEAECDHSTADDVTRRLQPPHCGNTGQGERNRPGKKALPLFPDGNIGITPSAGASSGKKQDGGWHEGAEEQGEENG